MACTVTLAGLSGSCDTSKGGIKKVWIANYAEGAYSVSGSTSGETIDAVVTGISSGVTFYEYNFKKNTCSMTSTLNVDAANGINYVSTELVLQFNKMDTQKRIEIASLATGDLLVVVEDSNGKRWALGFDEPVQATAGTSQSGTAKGDGNFYQITLTSEENTFPFEVSKDVEL